MGLHGFHVKMGAEYLFYMKSIETHARAFLALIILGLGTVQCVRDNFWQSDQNQTAVKQTK